MRFIKCNNQSCTLISSVRNLEDNILCFKSRKYDSCETECDAGKILQLLSNGVKRGLENSGNTPYRVIIMTDFSKR